MNNGINARNTNVYKPIFELKICFTIKNVKIRVKIAKVGDMNFTAVSAAFPETE
tara:strand:+ start:500 stop:661 length:162 start_codon:yes stop_codon:yes gene_type:complete